METETDFGYQQVPVGDKVHKVKEVFSSVANRYDLMNDLMSLGIHRLWKKLAIWHCHLKPGQSVLDLAGGTGDLTKQISRAVGETGEVVLGDINGDMLHEGRNRLIDQGYLHNINFMQINGETLPFSDNSFDCIIIGFGLRNFTNKQQALHEIYRVLKPAGRIIILEFSKPVNKILSKAYDTYSFSMLPLLGRIICNDAQSYQYLAESIRMHPDQETLVSMLQQAEFERIDYQNLTGGIVAIHKGFKF